MADRERKNNLRKTKSGDVIAINLVYKTPLDCCGVFTALDTVI